MSQSVNFPQEPLAFILWLQTPFSYELLIRSKAFFFFFFPKAFYIIQNSSLCPPVIKADLITSLAEAGVLLAQEETWQRLT